MNIENIRGWQFSQMEKMISTLDYVLHSVPEETLSTVRDGGDGWTVLEVLGHLNDFEAIFHERAQLTVTQDMPDLPFPNHDQLVIDNAYNSQTVDAIYGAWKSKREAYIAYLKGLNTNAWERRANHPSRGAFTLNDQLFLTLWHDSNHLEQIAHILRDAR